MIFNIRFTRTTEDGVQETDAGFRTPMQTLTDIELFDPTQLSASINEAIECFNRRGSGWQIDHVIDARLISCIYRPTQGSSFIATPKSIANKKAVTNVKNCDNLCFVWSVLASLNPASHNPDRLSNYEPHLDQLNITGLSFPLRVSDVRKFEELNRSISVNVNAYEHEPVPEIIPLYISPHRQRQHHVNLLLLTDDATGRQHYVLINNLSRLVHGRTAYKCKTHVCPYCLHCFSVSTLLDEHITECKVHNPQRISYPPPGEKVKFRNMIRTHKVPFVIYCDFESYLQPAPDSEDIVSQHVPSGFCCLRVSRYPEYETGPVVYSGGSDVMGRFYKHLRSEKREICRILGFQAPMKRLSKQQQSMYDSSMACPSCSATYSARNRKVRHHDHVTGDFVRPLCNNCNLQVKPRQALISKNHFAECVELENGDEVTNENEEEKRYFIPIVFHNLRGYDAHHIIKHLTNDSDFETNISVIPNNTERYISFEIEKLRFLDSYQFLSSSLDTLVGNLPKDQFRYTKRYLSEDDLVFRKGIFPYEYMTGEEVMNETCLPPQEAFYSSLTETGIDDEAYEHALQMWHKFGCKTFKDYHDLYLKLDVMLLADVFENFRMKACESYDLDPLHYLTLPSFSWDACLKVTRVQLDLMDTPEKFLMIENNIRGGISVVSHRHAKANNAYTDDYYDFSTPTSFLLYVDSNNLYGHAMRQPLPFGEFEFLSDEAIDNLETNIATIPADSETGYILDVDLDYPSELHDLHSSYPCAPERVTVTRCMLSDYSKNLSEGHPATTEKLIPNLNHKRNYVIHYRNLQLYLRLGLKLRKIHRALAFKQRPWLREYIDFNTEKRKQAANEFEKDFYKLLNNAVFGKSMESLRNRVNVHLVMDPVRCKKLAARPTLQRMEIINPDLVMMQLTRPHITQNKPIYVGFSVLELSKITMYEFHYDRIMKKYGSDARLLYTDTDSFIYSIQTFDLYKDMETDIDAYDTSNFNPYDPIYSEANKKVVGKFKSETSSIAPVEFVGLRSKLYSLKVDFAKKPKLTAKGVKRSYVERRLAHQDFLDTLNSKRSKPATFEAIRSRNHCLNTVKINKICLSAYDDKRYILDDGVTTLAYGHFRL